MFDYYILTFIDTGILEHWEKTSKQDWKNILKAQVPYQIQPEKRSSKLTLSNFGGVFVIYAAALLIPSLAFSYEKSQKLRRKAVLAFRGALDDTVIFWMFSCMSKLSGKVRRMLWEFIYVK